MKTNVGRSRIALILMAAIVIAASTAMAMGRQPKASTTADKATGAPAIIDVAAALAERSIGDAKAPVTIQEYASLTCSHCAHFSKEVFDKLKEKYVDTGKVRFVFNDFPLNAPALEASMVARCLPSERYFQFVKFLFETQDQWAFNAKYSDSLKQNAKLLGLGEEAFDACVGNEKLKEGLVEKMQAAGKENNIDATPTFIVNGKDKIAGAQPLEAFSKVIDPLLEAK